MEFVNKLLSQVQTNKWVTLSIGLIVALYGAFLAPALPAPVIRFFDTFLGKLLFLFLIAYLSTQNIQIALIVALGFLVTLNYATTGRLEGFETMVKLRVTQAVLGSRPVKEVISLHKEEILTHGNPTEDQIKAFDNFVNSTDPAVVKSHSELISEFCKDPNNTDNLLCKWIASLPMGATSAARPVPQAPNNTLGPSAMVNQPSKTYTPSTLVNQTAGKEAFTSCTSCGTGNVQGPIAISNQNYVVVPAFNLEGVSSQNYAPYLN
jgi:hypothetical protein